MQQDGQFASHGHDGFLACGTTSPCRQSSAEALEIAVGTAMDQGVYQIGDV